MNGTALSIEGGIQNNPGSITLTGSTLSIQGGIQGNQSNVTLSGSTLNVAGPFVSSLGGLSLNNASSATAAGLFDNTGGSITADGTGNTLAAQGINNTNGSIVLGVSDIADFRSVGVGQLVNLTGGVLNTGNYNLGGNLYYDTGGDGASTYIQGLDSVNMSIGGQGGIFFGSGAGTTNALGQLASIQSSTLNLTGQNFSIAPNGGGGALTLFAGQLSIGSSTLGVNGDLTMNTGSGLDGTNSNVSLTDSSLTLSGTFVNGGSTSGSQRVNVSNSSLTVGGAYGNLGVGGNDAYLSLQGSTASVGGLFTNSGGGQVLLNASQMAANGGFTNAGSYLTLQNGSAMTAAGGIDNTGGSISMDGTNNALIGTGLNNSNGTITLGATDIADFRNQGHGQLVNLTRGVLNTGEYNLGGNLYYDTGGDGASTYIQGLQSVFMSIGGQGGIFFGSGAGTTNALGQLSSIQSSTLNLTGQSFDINPNGSISALTLGDAQIGLFSTHLGVHGDFVESNSNVSLASGSSLSVDGAFINGGGSFTGEGVFVDSSSLSVGGAYNNFSGAGLNLANNSAATVGGIFTSSGGGQVLLSASTLTVGGAYDNLGGASLSLANNSAATVGGIFTNSGGSQVLLNASTLGVGGFTNAGSNLTLQNASTLNSPGLLDNTNGNISMDGTGNKLTATGLNNTNATITVGRNDTADFRDNEAGQLVNLSNGVLNTGTYNLDGKLFYDVGGDGTSTFIQQLNGVGLTLNSPGGIFFGAGAGTNALGQLSSLTASGLQLNGGNLTINPNGTNNTFVLNPQSSLNLAGASIGIQGGLRNNAGSIDIFGGSTLSAAGVFDNTGGTVSMDGTGNTLRGQGFNNTNGSITVNQSDVADFRNNGAGQLVNLTNGALVGGTYNIGGKLFYDVGGDGTSTYIQSLNGVSLNIGQQGGIFVGPGQGANALGQLASLQNTNLTLSSGSLAINPGGVNSTFVLDPSTLTLNGGTILNIGGAVNNTAGSSITLNGGSILNVGGAVSNAAGSSITLNGGGNVLTAQGLTNDGGLFIGSGDTADFRNGGANGGSTNTFLSLDGATGTLNGGNYDIAGTMLFDPASGPSGGNILKIGANATLTLDDAGGSTALLYGPGAGANALASLNEVAGTLNVGGGNFSNGSGLSRNFNPQGGTLTVDAGAAFNLSGGNSSFNNGAAVNIGGNLAVDSGGALNITNQSFNSSSVGASISGGVSNAGSININEPYGAGAPSMAGIHAGGNFVNTGTLNVNGGLTFVTSASLNNAGGTINIADGATLDARTGGAAGNSTNTFSNLDGTTGTLGGGVFNISGSFLFDPSSGQAGGNIFAIGAGTTLTLNNGAQIGYGPNGADAVAHLSEVAGTLNLTGVFSEDFTPKGGTLAVDQGGTMNLSSSFGQSSSVEGTLTNNGSVSISNFMGGLNVSGGLTNNNLFDLSNSATLNVSAALTNRGALTVSGGSSSLNVTGALFNTSPGVVNLSGDGNAVTASGPFVNSGTVNFSGSGATVSIGGDVTNAATGLVSMAGTNDTIFTGGNLNNFGGITIGATESVTAALGITQAGTLTIDSGGDVTVLNGGTFTQTDGVTTVNAGGAINAGLVDLQGGTLAGGGTINASLLVDGGTLAPGDPQSTSVSNDFQVLSPGVLDFDLASPISYDQVIVGGNVALDGTLDLTLESGFTAATGDIFRIITWGGGETGDFATFNDQIFDGGALTFAESFQGNELDLTVVDASTPAPSAPEPSTLAMMFGAMLLGGAVGWRVRRRRANQAN